MDRVGDFIVRLQNAAMIGRHDVDVPYSRHLSAIAKKLKELSIPIPTVLHSMHTPSMQSQPLSLT